MRPRRIAAMLGLLLAAACGPRRWTGPLAAVADSVLAGVGHLECDRDGPQSRVGPLRFAEPPFTYCRGRKGDTSVFVTHGADRRVVWVNWHWKPRDGQTAGYESLLARLEARHGPSRLCPRSDDASVTQHRRWQAPGHGFGVLRLFEDRVGMSYDLGPIDCHAA